MSLAVASLLLGAVGGVNAQVDIEVEVVSGDSGAPIENVVVRIPDLDSYMLTDSMGRALLEGVRRGTYRLILTRMGYEEQRGEFTIERPGSIRIALAPVLVRSDAEPGEVFGRVLDPDTRMGLAGAEVSIAGVLRRVTDQDGWFTIELVPPGSHLFEASYLGRQSLADSIFVEDGQRLEVEVPLPLEAIELEGLTVTAQPKFLTDVGFYRRVRSGTMYRGGQWTASDLADRNVGYLDEVIIELPAIMRTIPGAGEGTATGYRAFRCRLATYVDDFLMDPWFDLDHIDPARVAALEVFYGRPLPLKYEVAGHCGVVLVWLKRRT